MFNKDSILIIEGSYHGVYGAYLLWAWFESRSLLNSITPALMQVSISAAGAGSPMTAASFHKKGVYSKIINFTRVSGS